MEALEFKGKIEKGMIRLLPVLWQKNYVMSGNDISKFKEKICLLKKNCIYLYSQSYKSC